MDGDIPDEMAFASAALNGEEVDEHPYEEDFDGSDDPDSDNDSAMFADYPKHNKENRHSNARINYKLRNKKKLIEMQNLAELARIEAEDNEKKEVERKAKLDRIIKKRAEKHRKEKEVMERIR